MALVYNQPRFAQTLLERYKQSPPSFSIDYYDDHWLLNKGHAKFLYTQPLSALLDDVNALRIPVDFIEIFDAANVPYYEGCMIVETVDHRRPRTHLQQSSNKEPESVRVVLHPNDETLYADLCLLNAKYGNTWTDMEALEIEAKTLTAITPSLHLDPDPNYTRIVNSVIRATTSPDTVLRKRKQDQEPEENESEKAKRAKLWSQYMHPRHGKPSISQKRSLFDILGDIATKDQKGVYKVKTKTVRPPKREPVVNAQPPPYLAAPAQQEVSSLPVATTSAVTLQDESRLRAPAPNAVPKHVPEVPVMTNGKSRTGTAPPMTAASPIIPSPISEQHRGSLPPAVNRTPVVTVSALASSPTPAPQFPPAASPRPPSLPVGVPQVVNKPKPIPIPMVPQAKEDYHPPVPGTQGAPPHPQAPAVTVIPPNLPQNASVQWQRYLAGQKQAPQLQLPLFQQSPAQQAPAKPPQPQPQTQLTHPYPQQQQQQQPQPQPRSLPQQSLAQPQPLPQAQPQLQSQLQPQQQSQLQPQPQPRPQSQPQPQPQPQLQTQVQTSAQSQPPPQPHPQPKPQLQSQKKQPTPHPPQAAVGHPPQTSIPGVVNHAGYPQNMYKAPGVVAQTPSPNHQRSSPLAHPPQQQAISQGAIPHVQNAHLPTQLAQQPIAGAPAQSHPAVPHANQWSLQQQQQAARYLQGQQAAAAAAAAAGHHPQAMPQHGHSIAQQHHPQQQQSMARPAQGVHDPAQQAMMHAQMQYNPMYSYQAMHAAGMMRMPANAGAQNANAQYMAQAQAWRGRGGPGPVPMNAQYLQAAQQQQAQILAAMRAHQQQQAQVPQGTQR